MCEAQYFTRDKNEKRGINAKEKEENDNVASLLSLLPDKVNLEHDFDKYDAISWHHLITARSLASQLSSVIFLSVRGG